MTKICVHQFKLTDCEDPELIAAHSLYAWEKSPVGQFVMSHAIETPYWIKKLNVNGYYWNFEIIADLPDIAITEFYLKWK